MPLFCSLLSFEKIRVKIIVCRELIQLSIWKLNLFNNDIPKPKNRDLSFVGNTAWAEPANIVV